MTASHSPLKATPAPNDHRPVYLVTGYMRSGTSMMMRALGAGGMDLAYDPARDEMNEQWGDESYKPNEGGFFELSSASYKSADFPLAYKGKLIKALFGALYRLPVWKYNIVMMVRDPEEIRQSYEAFFSKACPRVAGKPFAEDSYYDTVRWWSGQLDNRRDVRLTLLHYRTVVENPVGSFLKLKNNGWPIDAYAAAHVVNPELCRFRREELVEGL